MDWTKYTIVGVFSCMCLFPTKKKLFYSIQTAHRKQNKHRMEKKIDIMIHLLWRADKIVKCFFPHSLFITLCTFDAILSLFVACWTYRISFRINFMLFDVLLLLLLLLLSFQYWMEFHEIPNEILFFSLITVDGDSNMHILNNSNGFYTTNKTANRMSHWKYIFMWTPVCCFSWR